MPVPTRSSSCATPSRSLRSPVWARCSRSFEHREADLPEAELRGVAFVPVAQGNHDRPAVTLVGLRGLPVELVVPVAEILQTRASRVLLDLVAHRSAARPAFGADD